MVTLNCFFGKSGIDSDKIITEWANPYFTSILAEYCKIKWKNILYSAFLHSTLYFDYVSLSTEQRPKYCLTALYRFSGATTIFCACCSSNCSDGCTAVMWCTCVSVLSLWSISYSSYAWMEKTEQSTAERRKQKSRFSAHIYYHSYILLHIRKLI